MGSPAQIFITKPHTGLTSRARQAPAQVAAVPVAVTAIPVGTMSSAQSISARPGVDEQQVQTVSAASAISNRSRHDPVKGRLWAHPQA
jgi:hypothetical protein